MGRNPKPPAKAADRYRKALELCVMTGPKELGALTYRDVPRGFRVRGAWRSRAFAVHMVVYTGTAEISLELEMLYSALTAGDWVELVAMSAEDQFQVIFEARGVTWERAPRRAFGAKVREVLERYRGAWLKKDESVVAVEQARTRKLEQDRARRYRAIAAERAAALAKEEAAASAMAELLY